MYCRLLEITLLISVTGQLQFSDEQLPQQSGIYFENQGPIKIVTTRWELTAFLDITYCKTQYENIKKYIELAHGFCENFSRINITQTHCDELYVTLKGLAKKIELKEKLLFESIGLPHRNRRQANLLSTLAKTAQILFGICDINCLTNSNTRINEMRKSGLKENKILENRVKILEINQERESETTKASLETVYELKNWTDEVRIRNRILQHFVRMNILLNQYTFETNTLSEIIQLARIGQIHPSLFTKQELINQLRDIKVSVPSGTDLPIDTERGDPYELLGLSDVIIYYSDNKIVFKINIPLVYQHTLTLYHLIPKPVCILNNCIYIKTSYNFLAVSRSKELYATYDEHKTLKCKRAHEFLLCP